MNKTLKTYVKWLVVVVLAVAAAIGGFYFNKVATAPVVRSGVTVKFTTGKDYFLLINADSVTFEAASSEYFALYNTTGETIIPIQTPPPLGWMDNTYYVFKPTLISGGKWIISKGNTMVRITNTTPIIVTEVMTEGRLKTVGQMSIILAILVWFIMLLLLVPTHFYDW